MMDIKLRTIKEEDLFYLWEISYGSKADLEWMKFNGPYFNDPILNWEEFFAGYGKDIIDDAMVKVITVNNKIVGIVTAYWEDGSLRQWLEMGILLYDSSIWGRGIGSTALSMWMVELFDKFEYLPHVGFTTWSGNISMQKIGDKCGMTKEGVIRKVRYLNGVYYDSVKYGILREEMLIK
ncbi:GNAT family N-acetyltransferase [Vagococcus sp. JNUCC 83]